MRSVAIGLAFFALLVPALVVLSPFATAPAAAEEGEHELVMDESFDLEKLFRRVGEETGLAIVWDPQDKAIRGKTISGPFTMRGTAPELLKELRSLITFFDLVMVPIGPKGRERYMVMDARQTQSILKLKPAYVTLTDDNLAEYESQDGLFVTSLIAVPNVMDLASVRNGLQRIVTGQNIGSVQEVPPGSILVTDFAPNVATIYRTLKILGQQAATRAVSDDVRTVRLVHASATELGSLLSTQFGASTAPIPAGPQQRPPVTVSTPLRVQGEPRTNTLIVSGPPEAVARVLEVVKVLDVPGDAPTGPASASHEEPTLLRLRNLRVSLDVEEQPLDEVIRTLQTATRVQIVVTPSARSAAFRAAQVTLHVREVTADRILDLICPPGSCTWKVDGGIVYVTDFQGR